MKKVGLGILSGNVCEICTYCKNERLYNKHTQMKVIGKIYIFSQK